MDKIQAAIKCPNCSKTLSTPVILPCAHSICQEHTNVEEEEILCGKCGQTHSTDREFVVNQLLIDIITAQIDSIDFGVVHNEAKKSCDQLDEEVTKAEAILKDMNFFIHQSVEELKNEVHLRREEFKIMFDEAAEKLISDLDDYEDQCNENLESKILNASLDEMKQLKDTTREILANSYRFLNLLKYDEAKCNQTKTEISKSMDEFNKSFESFKQKILLNQIACQKLTVQSFCQTKVEIKIR